MGQDIIHIIDENIDSDFIEMIISNSSDKDKISKIKVRPILIKKVLYYQVEEFRGKQVFHSNKTKEELLTSCQEWFQTESSDTEVVFRQAQIQCRSQLIHLLISKKGKLTIKRKNIENIRNGQDPEDMLSHNRKKSYLLKEGISVPFLVDLGVMTKEGRIVRSKYDKYRQINRFLEFVEDILPHLDSKRELTIIDFGCGKSYLTFAMYYYLREMKGYSIKMIGLDLKEEVIEHCNQLSKRYGYDNLHFIHGDIVDYNEVKEVDMVVTLHACDTATDYALYKAVRWNAKVILSVPCCQHEWNQQMKEKPLKNLMKYGLINERISALYTDALRGNILEANGYKTNLLEFIDMEHTPKNILVRGTKNRIRESQKEAEITKQIEETIEFFGVNPTLYQLLMNGERE